MKWLIDIVALLAFTASSLAGEIYFPQTFRGDVTLAEWTNAPTAMFLSVTNGGMLQAGTNYYALAAQSPMGISALSPVTNAVTTNGSQAILISWPRVPGATNYLLYRSRTPGALSNYVATGSITNTVDAGIFAWRTNDFVATATNSPSLFLNHGAVESNEPVTLLQLEEVIAELPVGGEIPPLYDDNFSTVPTNAEFRGESHYDSTNGAIVAAWDQAATNGNGPVVINVSIDDEAYVYRFDYSKDVTDTCVGGLYVATTASGVTNVAFATPGHSTGTYSGIIYGPADGFLFDVQTACGNARGEYSVTEFTITRLADGAKLSGSDGNFNNVTAHLGSYKDIVATRNITAYSQIKAYAGITIYGVPQPYAGSAQLWYEGFDALNVGGNFKINGHLTGTTDLSLGSPAGGAGTIKLYDPDGDNYLPTISCDDDGFLFTGFGLRLADGTFAAHQTGGHMTTLSLRDASSSGDSIDFIITTNGNDNALHIGEVDEPNGLSVVPDGSDRFNVGVGVANPGERLEVDGNVSALGYLVNTHVGISATNDILVPNGSGGFVTQTWVYVAGIRTQ